MRKLRELSDLRWVIQLNKWQGQDLIPGSVAPGTVLLTIILYCLSMVITGQYEEGTTE